MSVLVFGSINIDLVARVPRLPTPGETLFGHNFETISGGKGANQAVAVARLGVPVRMIGRVGGDDFGQQLLAGLRTDGVLGTDTLADAEPSIFVDETTHSGVAVIAVDDAAENHIIVISGANARMDDSDIQRLNQFLPQATHLLMQLEIPLPVIVAAAQAAKQAGVTVILDPAPARTDLPTELLNAVDIVTPNQVEAGQLVGFPVQDWDSAEQAAIALQARGIQTVIIKLGSQGALCKTPQETFKIPVFPVQAIDTVAAGDAFNGGLAAALAQGMDLRAATRQAAAVAALSVTKAGAQTSLPTLAELQAFLRQH